MNNTLAKVEIGINPKPKGQNLIKVRFFFASLKLLFLFVVFIYHSNNGRKGALIDPSQVILSIDVNGILNVKAIDKDTNEEVAVTIRSVR